VRLSHSVAQIEERLNPLRWFVLGTFAAGVAVAVALSIVLAESLGSSIQRLAGAVDTFSVDAPPQELPVSGSREMQTLTAHYNDMAKRLYEYEASRRRLLAGIVHEVSRPLGGINAAAQLLSRRENPEPELVHELGGEIEAEVNEIMQQVDDLVLLAQSDRGTLQLQQQVVDLTDLFAERCGQAVARICKEGLQFDAHFAANLPPAYVDPSRIAQVLCNLLDNARKYTSPGGLVTFDARLEEDAGGAPAIAMRVSDSGPGIPLDEQEKIFQYFYRIPQQGRVTEGMGIGLPLARQLAEAHGGTLELESLPGQGATFVLRVPACGEQS
jgi:signal transduction histidine kinase